MRRLTIWGVAIVLLVVGAAAAVALRLPQMAGTAIGEQVGATGFAVRRVELRGLNRMDHNIVYNAVLDQPSRAMPLVDLDAIRARLMTFPWIKDARVSRRLPDTLVVEVVERTPAALWQNGRRLFLVDGEGVALREVHPDAVPTLPTLAGPGAERRVHDLGSLLEAAPRLRPLLANANWIGDRRWDLRFHTGETLALPEGMEPAQRALRRFADMDQRRQLLGGNFVRFDMRIEGRMIVRLKPGQNGELPAVAPPVAAGQSPEEMARTI
ncbi:MAG: hypothetical protein JWL74_752 [Alphaproteobacteria bacterium]|nr:hypothetical protein [Alphaproteobacteria bacterium]